MRLLVLILASLVPASSAAVEPSRVAGPTGAELQKLPVSKAPKVMLPGQKCTDDPRLRFTHDESPGTSKPKNLGELPPGNLQLAVMRSVDGCVEPVIVRYGFGGEPAAEKPRAAPRP